MKRRPGRVRLQEVAERAGVSAATASRVMNGHPTVDATIAERVRTASAELHYLPHALGRGLVLGRTETIGVVVPDLTNPTFQDLIRGLSRAAAPDGYRVLFADSSETPSEEAILAEEMHRRCDGVVLAAPRMPAEQLAGLRARLHPLVVCNRMGESEVAIDYRLGQTLLAEHLHQLGHRHLLFLSGPQASVSNRLRLAALETVGEAHPDLTVDVVACGVDLASGHAAAEAVLASGATGVLAYNDLVAMGLLNALTRRGVRCPEQLSVTGFDDIPLARWTTPPLTTCATPVSEAAELCWTVLQAYLAQQRPSERVLAPELVVRESSGPPPAG